MTVQPEAAQNEASVSAGERARLMTRATYLAAAVAIMLIAGKAVAYFLTGSVAMLATLVDSCLDGLASLLNLVAVRHSLTPADREHRFGHGKAEAIAALGQSIFILASAAFVVYEAIGKFTDPEPTEHGLLGIAIIVFAILVTIGLVGYQRHVVRKTGSLAISADSLHYSGDLIMNVAVIAALLLTSFFGFHWADPVSGIFIAALIAWGATQIAGGAFNQLMDRELPEEERERIKDIVRQHPQVANLHDLRTRSAGAYRFIQFHLELIPDISLKEAHEISNQVERRIVEVFPNAEVLIHQDPANSEILTPLQRT